MLLKIDDDLKVLNCYYIVIGYKYGNNWFSVKKIRIVWLNEK